MEKAIKRYWPVFVLPTLIAFIIGFVVAFRLGRGAVLLQVHYR